MNISKARLASMVVGSFWMLAAGVPAQADDTELFVATSTGAGIRPNVLFIIDNSGSMGTDVVTQGPYDPTYTYTGGSCDATRV
jgi:type IV pilus assembly protein PilY1